MRPTKTKLDWAVEVARPPEGRYAACPPVTLVCDNLNTNTAGASYAAFQPARARELVARIRFCYTPKDGSWQNVAGCELSAPTRQCVDGRRFGDEEVFRTKAAA